MCVNAHVKQLGEWVGVAGSARGRVNTGVAQVLQAMQSLVGTSAKCTATMMQSVG